MEVHAPNTELVAQRSNEHGTFQIVRDTQTGCYLYNHIIGRRRVATEYAGRYLADASDGFDTFIDERGKIL